jgi:asparagine synthase (glutamine-hydrolysing)
VRSQEGFPWAQNTALRASFLSAGLRQKIDPEAFVMDHYRSTVLASDILPENKPQARRMKEMINLNMRWFMQTLLDRKDRMSMFNGLEVRVPFCDYRLAEYLYCVPWEYKYHGGKEKGLLRYAMADYLPQEILYRKKSPYPKTYNPRYTTLVMDKLKKIMEDRNAPIHEILDTKKISLSEYEAESWPWYGQLMKTPQTLAYFVQLNFWLVHNNIDIVL